MSIISNIIPISDLRQDAAGIIQRATASREPVVITQRGRASAVMVSAQTYEHTQRELEFLRLLARGEAEIEQGKGYDMDLVFAEADQLLKDKDS
jgi:prevent-host-death family protein